MTEVDERKGWSGAAWVPQLAVALVVGAILWVAWRDRPAQAPMGTAPDALAAEQATGGEESDPAPLAPEATRVPAPPVVVRVVDDGGVPRSGVVVEVRAPDPRGGADLLEEQQTSDATGLATFDGLRDELAALTGARSLLVAFPGTDAPLGRLTFPVRAVPVRTLVLVHQGTPAQGGEPPLAPAGDDTTSGSRAPVEADALVGLDPGATGLDAAGTEPRAGTAEPDPGAPGIGTSEPGLSSDEPVVAAPTPRTTPVDPVSAEPLTTELAEPPPSAPRPGSPRPTDDPAPRPPAPEPLPSGSVLGRLHLDLGVPAGALRVELDELLPEADVRGRRLGPLAPAPDGSFRFDGVAPGLLALRVSLLGTRRTLVWVDDLLLEPGAELRDPRAWCAPDATPEEGGVDLRGRLVPIGVELLDEFGRRLDPAVVLPFDRGTGERGLLELQTEGTTPRLWGDRRVLEGSAELDLLLVAPDRAVREVGLSGQQLGGGRGGERGLSATGDQALSFELVPARARPIELRLVGWPGGPGVVLEPRYAAGLRLEARLEREDGQRFPWDHERHRGQLDERGRLRLAPADPGRFVVRLAWLDEDGGRTDLDLAVPIQVGVASDDPTDEGAAPRDVVFLPIGRGGL